MIDTAECLEQPRRRRRSRRRKFVESVALILGVPALLFVVLALSVEVIEYRPVQEEGPDMAGVMPPERLEIPPIRVEPLRLRGQPTQASLQLE